MAAKNFKITGFKEAEKALEALPKEFSTAKKRGIGKKGMQAFINSAKQKAPVQSGTLRASIGTKTFRNNKDYVFGGVVTNKSIKSVTGDKIKVDGFYAKFIEYGFTQIAWGTKGKTIRNGLVYKSQMQKIEPKPFLRPAWDETRDKVKRDTIKLVIKRLRAYERKNKKT